MKEHIVAVIGGKWLLYLYKLYIAKLCKYLNSRFRYAYRTPLYSLRYESIHSLRSEGLIIPESMAQDFGFTGVLGKQAVGVEMWRAQA